MKRVIITAFLAIFSVLFCEAQGIRDAIQQQQQQQRQETGRQQPGQANVKNTENNGILIEMIFVQGGTFTMGCTYEQGGDCKNNEKPAHQVTVSSFYIGKYEITQTQWKAVMGANPSDQIGDYLPVENVSWYDCQEFIRRLNAQTGKNYRLPTEAEWEYAARGGNRSKGYRYSGSHIFDNVGWYVDNSEEQTHPVGTKAPNELGIYDMSGNVWEWCSDWFGDYSGNAQANPAGPSSGYFRIYRGGSLQSVVSDSRVTFRNYYKPGDRRVNLGLRLVISST